MLLDVVLPIPYLMAGPEALELGCEGASRELQTLERELVHDGSLDGVDREFIMHRGGVWEELQEIVFEKQIDLVVIGTHGRRGIEKLLLGSVAERVFRHADCPVLTVGPHSYLEGGVECNGIPTYLFATDFGEPFLGALPYAVSLAKGTKAKLVLVHVVPALPYRKSPDGTTHPRSSPCERIHARPACGGSNSYCLATNRGQSTISLSSSSEYQVRRFCRLLWKGEQTCSFWAYVARFCPARFRTYPGPQPMRSCVVPHVRY